MKVSKNNLIYNKRLSCINIKKHNMCAEFNNFFAQKLEHLELLKKIAFYIT